MVLVGGLSLKYLTRDISDELPGPVTMDVDLGITVGASGDTYGTIGTDLQAQGFRPEKGRYVRQVNEIPLYVDFLTDDNVSDSGTALVDDVPAGVFPGVTRALQENRKVSVAGRDLYGAPQKFTIPVADVGPLLVLKLNAFAGRQQQPKDAYDILLATRHYIDGAEMAVRKFQAEQAVNRAYPRARETLQQFFVEADQSGPLRCAEFLRPASDEDYEQRRQLVIQDAVTIGRLLLGE
jgi:predicted nucleotidyltransferase